jgi:hypothetical protein
VNCVQSSNTQYTLDVVNDKFDNTIVILSEYRPDRVQAQLDGLLTEPFKFICLNNNINYKFKEKAERIGLILSKFTQKIFPDKSYFEL